MRRDIFIALKLKCNSPIPFFKFCNVGHYTLFTSKLAPFECALNPRRLHYNAQPGILFCSTDKNVKVTTNIWYWTKYSSDKQEFVSANIQLKLKQMFKLYCAINWFNSCKVHKLGFWCWNYKKYDYFNFVEETWFINNILSNASVNKIVTTAFPLNYSLRCFMTFIFVPCFLRVYTFNLTSGGYSQWYMAYFTHSIPVCEIKEHCNQRFEWWLIHSVIQLM